MELIRYVFAMDENSKLIQKKEYSYTQAQKLNRDYEEKSVNKIFYDNDRRKACIKSVFHLALYIAVTKLHVKSGREIRPFF